MGGIMEDWFQRDENLLALIAHEIRGPLESIVNASYLIEASKASSPSNLQFLEMIRRQAGQLTELMDCMTLFTRINTGKHCIDQDVVMVDHFLREALEATQFALGRKKISVKVEGQPDEIKVFGASCLLAQVLINLLHNAAKFSPRSSLIQIGVSKVGEECQITVKDNGVGMTANQLQRIFTAYSQLGKSDVGMGLGLFISNHYVKIYGGRIEALSSGIGKGSEFRVFLPLADPFNLVSSDPPDIIDATCERF